VRDNRDNRLNQPNNERPGSLIMRGANQSERQTPIREQNPRQNAVDDARRGQQPNAFDQPDRGDNRRVVTPPMTPGGQPFRNQQDGARQNPARDFNQPSVTRPDLEQSQRQQRQLLQQQQQQQQQGLQQQQRQLQQQQREFQQQQRDIQPQRQQRDFQPRQEAPTRSFETPRVQPPAYQPPTRSEGTPRMQESRPAPEMRSTPQYSAPIPRSDSGGGGRGGDGGGNRGGGGNGNGNNWNNNNGGGGRGR